ncbi:hypothetical protein NEUTE1DRAFT_40460 [Neurospora tetrasperma FGSC 2508]|uniref:SWIM-type domain-containing protein n=1 Tax=Neurospora tetrasperma (strain FGSC 2508 / ATCC MYA-4615 / P0657) TaxID=510951 RepID=F8MIK9_NEUT8|nr:uncharacterized protein NEUTE1DRAFT_40460 [Neurospora tetrasperma FGSC 2508]EGO59810.1 hypothetical protein NEUTE1DRAFT_40460 [Neurospora tetrasperma FGSC 2508]EGZ73958.1 hypothetical protein NEUTE2DRAFT_128303 [Neurospora tetrasperma FGSC 2509]
MEIRSKEDLIEYLPNDAPWTVYRDPVEALRAQCVKRGLDPTGHVVEVLNRLHRYSQLHNAGEQRIVPWRCGEHPLYVGALYHAQDNRYLIISVEDNSNDTSIEKRFTLWDPSSIETFHVIIGRVSRCSCRLSREEVSRKNYVCGHIVTTYRKRNLEALLPPPVPYGNDVCSYVQSDDESSDDHMTQSSSDDDEWEFIRGNGGGNDIFNGDSAKRSIEFFAERSQILPGSPSIESSKSSPAVSEEEPESPCPLPRRQLPSRAAKEATRARPDAYTGSSPRRKAQAPSREPMPKEWTKKLSTTLIPLPVIPGFARQQLFGSQPARRSQNAVSIPIVPASAQGRLRSSQANGYGIPLRTATATGSHTAPAPTSVAATAHSVSGLAAASSVPFSGTDVAHFSPFFPSPAPYSPPVGLGTNDPFLSFPMSPDGSKFSSMSLAAPDTNASASTTKRNKKKGNLVMSPENKKRTAIVSVRPMVHQVSNALDGILADCTTTTSTSVSAATTTTATTAGVSTTANSAKQRDRRMARLVRQMSRLEKDAEKVKQTKEYAEQELKRMERKRRNVVRKMNKLWDRDRDRSV